MIVVTGADGLIGSNVIWHLNCQGRDDILAVDTARTLAAPKYLPQLQIANVVPHDELADWMRRHSDHVDAVVHLGACTSTTERDASVFRRLNLEYSQMLWNVCTSIGARLIYASSASTYGLGQQGFSDEGDLALLRPLNLYAQSKHAFDLWVAAQQSGPTQWAGLKFFNVYGPDEYHKGSMSSVIYRLTHDLQLEGRVRIFDGPDERYRHGKQARDFVYSKDVARVIDFLLSHPDVSGLFNVGTGEPRSFNDVAHAVAEALGSELVIEYTEMPEAMRAHYQYLTCAEIRKLRAAGYVKQFRSLEEGVKDYLSNYLMNGNACLSVNEDGRGSEGNRVEGRNYVGAWGN